MFWFEFCLFFKKEVLKVTGFIMGMFILNYFTGHRCQVMTDDNNPYFLPSSNIISVICQ